MSKLKVAASTFPFLYSHSGIGALEHLASLGFNVFEMMIFPPHCWPADMSIRERNAIRSKLDGEGWKPFELLTTERALGDAPELGAAAAKVHIVPSGQVPDAEKHFAKAASVPKQRPSTKACAETARVSRAP